MIKSTAYPYNTINGKDFFVENFGLRFHFNGKEIDNETKTQDYGMRIYDPRLGRFLSTDPLTKNYAFLTPYQFASNTPIMGIDLDGMELQPINSSMYRMKYLGSTTALSTTSNDVVQYKINTVDVINKNIPANYNNGNQKGIVVGTNGKDVPMPTIGAAGAAMPIKVEDENADPTRIKLTKKGQLKEKINKPALNYNNVMGGITMIMDAIDGTFKYMENVANNDEYKDRSFFYKATNWVDSYMENGDISKASNGTLNNPQSRAHLINYVNDGSLPEYKEGDKEAESYNSTIKKVGDLILKAKDVEIRQ